MGEGSSISGRLKDLRNRHGSLPGTFWNCAYDCEPDNLRETVIIFTCKLLWIFPSLLFVVKLFTCLKLFFVWVSIFTPGLAMRGTPRVWMLPSCEPRNLYHLGTPCGQRYFVTQPILTATLVVPQTHLPAQASSNQHQFIHHFSHTLQ